MHNVYKKIYFLVLLLFISNIYAATLIRDINSSTPDTNYGSIRPNTSIYCTPSGDHYLSGICTQAIEITPAVALASYTTNYIAPNQGDQIKKVIIVVHGAYANLAPVFAATAANHESDTAVIVPFFGSINGDVLPPDVTVNPANPLTILRWESGDWLHGALSSKAYSDRAGSFNALDELAQKVVSDYPNVEEVVFAGFSAGGQVLQRFAGFSNPNFMRNGQPANIKVRYIVASPSSYMYLDNKRILSQFIGECDEHSCQIEPSSFWVPSSNVTCPNYNEFRYGLDAIPKTLVSEFPITTNTIISNYLNAKIDYLVNTGDANDTPHSYTGDVIAPSADCSAVMDAPADDSYRMQRGLVFEQYLNAYQTTHNMKISPTHNFYIYDGKATTIPVNSANPPISDLPTDCEHNDYCIWGSDVGQALLKGTTIPE